MGAAFVRIDFSDMVPASTGSYVDVDVQDHGASADAVGVSVLIQGYDQSLAIRKNGSTDTFDYLYMYFTNSGHQYVGVDANGILEIKTGSTNAKFLLDGEFLDPFTFFTNAYNKEPSSVNSYLDIDVSTECPDASMVIVTLIGNTLMKGCARKNGSTDDRDGLGAYSNVSRNHGPNRFVGVDASQIYELKMSTLAGGGYVQGYYDGEAITMHTNATDRSITTTGSWVDLGALPDDSLFGMYELEVLAASGIKGAVRKNGSSDDPYLQDVYWTQGTLAECDGSYLVEAKIESSSLHIWEVGYGVDEISNTAPTAPTSLLCEGSTNPTGVTDLTPEFSTIFNDPDTGDESNAIEIHVGSTNDPENSPNMWDSGTIAETVTEGDRCSNISYDGTTLVQAGQIYYWTCRFRDDDDEWGPWSAVASFTFAPKDVSVSDSGAGTDVVSAVQAAISVSDDGAGSDDVSKANEVSVLDSGIGTDIVSAIQAAVVILEDGIGSDSISAVQATLSLSDNGAGIDTVTVNAELSVLDSGIGVDSVSVAVTLAVADSGVGTDSINSVTISVSLLDAGIGTDEITEVLSAVTIADSGVGTELVSILAQIGIADGGVGTDLLSLVQSLVSIADSGVGVEAPIVVLNWRPNADLTIQIQYQGTSYDGSGNAIVYDGSGNLVTYEL